MNDNVLLLEMENISKQFPGVLANDRINFNVKSGEIHSLLGENGAGKSTLMNILYGLAVPDSGVIRIRGNEAHIKSPLDAIHKGIGMVHQHFMLVERLTVVENVIIGTRPPGYPLFNQKETTKHVAKIIEDYGFDLDPLSPIHYLSVGQQQRVEIIKALYRGADLLILDEPTAVLTPPEVDELFRLLNNLRDAGHGIVFISHKLNETLEISDRITVIRQGRVVGSVIPEDTDRAGLASLMVGRSVLFDIPHPEYSGEQPVILDVQDLHVLNERHRKAVDGISLQVRNGEILGIAGVDGNGQRELAEALTGLRSASGGSVSICGENILGLHPDQILSKGVAHIPEDRHRRGLVLGFRIDENIVLHDYGNAPFSKYSLINHRQVLNHAQQLAVEFDIRPPTPTLKARQLSGGNQQKVVLARELSNNPQLIIAMQPTRGLDVGATEYVRQKLVEARTNGAAVLLISTELEEVLSISDDIAVIYEGKIAGNMKRGNFDIEHIGLLMGGAQLDRDSC
jgi:general nucleoside transport system ATP-binding protein